MSIVARLEMDALHPEKELAALLERCKGDGAVVSFTGVARPGSKQGEAVYRLVLEHHPALTVRSLEEIAVEAAASSVHRRAAFEAADYLMDRLKTEAVFWKREVGENGSEWIEPTEADYGDHERWG